MQWDVKLNDRGSEVYQSLSNQIAKNIATIFAIYPSAKEDLVVKVVKFSSDEGLRVTSTLWWRSPQELHLTSQSSVMKILVDSIRKDNGKLHNHFDIDRNSVSVSRVIKNCRTLGCKNVDCDFSLDELRFFCLCEDATMNKVDCVLKNQTTPLEFSRKAPKQSFAIKAEGKEHIKAPSQSNKDIPEQIYLPSVIQTSSSTEDSLEPMTFETNYDLANASDKALSIEANSRDHPVGGLTN